MSREVKTDAERAADALERIAASLSELVTLLEGMKSPSGELLIKVKEKRGFG